MARLSKTLRASHPDSPWMWREDWAKRRIKSSHGAVAAIAWLFALTFGGFSVPMTLKAGEIAASEGVGVLAMAALFPLASLGLLYWAVTSTARWMRFRNIQLELETLPGVVGGRFAAIVHAGTTLPSETSFRARLSCLKRSRRGNKTRESTLWQHELVVPGSRISRGPFGAAVPVAFEIPFESEPSSADPSQLPAVQWRLEVDAELAGADFQAVFDVPIFKTDDSSPDVSERFELGPDDEVTEAPATSDDLDPAFSDARIQLRPSADGGAEVFLPAGRNKAGALFLTIFAAGWNGFIAYAASMMPGWFALTLLPFAGIGLLLLLFVPAAWFQTTTLRATASGLTIHHSTLGMGSPLVLRPDRIESIVPEAKGGGSGAASWSVRVKVRGRAKPRLAASNLADKADAEKIARALWEPLRRAASR